MKMLRPSRVILTSPLWWTAIMTDGYEWHFQIFIISRTSNEKLFREHNLPFSVTQRRYGNYVDWFET